VTIALELPDAVLDTLAERIAEIVLARMTFERGSSWLTVEQVAGYLQTTPDAIRALVKRSKIPAHRAGGRLLFERDEIDIWVKAS
jgi:excisionase family DNA binding protein